MAVDKVNPTQIGWLFVQQYYTFMNESPERLHLFYNKNSTFIFGREGENQTCISGQQVAFFDCRTSSRKSRIWIFTIARSLSQTLTRRLLVVAV
jgi:hypothetical protein